METFSIFLEFGFIFNLVIRLENKAEFIFGAFRWRKRQYLENSLVWELMPTCFCP